MEKVAEMDLKTLALNPNAEMKQYVLDKHYMRKAWTKCLLWAEVIFRHLVIYQTSLKVVKYKGI